uniref:Uncharacterized protein n=1 Tax=Physcomitrium patens TaxID=3218 RepID=A0A2K1JC60_PHYPA|nr:hypothetical protein PHYPA_019393 [Physcomitrium patens]
MIITTSYISIYYHVDLLLGSLTFNETHWTTLINISIESASPCIHS